MPFLSWTQRTVGQNLSQFRLQRLGMSSRDETMTDTLLIPSIIMHSRAYIYLLTDFLLIYFNAFMDSCLFHWGSTLLVHFWSIFPLIYIVSLEGRYCLLIVLTGQPNLKETKNIFFVTQASTVESEVVFRLSSFHWSTPSRCLILLSLFSQYFCLCHIWWGFLIITFHYPR